MAEYYSFSSLLAACGGGGSLEKDGGSLDGSETVEPGVVENVTLSLSIRDVNGLEFTADNPVSKENKGTVTATLLDSGTPLNGQLISFTTNFTGRITPVLGTTLTNSSGEASVTLSSGDSKGAGQVLASYMDDNGETITQVAGFISNGDDASTELAQYSVSVSLLTGCNPSWDENRNNVGLDPTYKHLVVLSLILFLLLS